MSTASVICPLYSRQHTHFTDEESEAERLRDMALPPKDLESLSKDLQVPSKDLQEPKTQTRSIAWRLLLQFKTVG